MWPSQRLMFYTAPMGQGIKSSLQFWLGVWVCVCVFLAFVFPSKCAEVICTASDKANALVAFAIVALIALVAILIYAAATWFAPHRSLALKVTPGGLISASSRFPDEVIGWADIESIGLYQDVAVSNPDCPVHYLAVTVHSPEGMHDSEVMESVWRQYPRVPEMERVALMLRLERVYDANGAAMSPADVVERIQICFPEEIGANGVEIFEEARLV